MRKWFTLLLALVLACSLTASLAEPTMINAAETRDVQIHATGDNLVEPDVSPTTGLTLSEMDIPDNFVGLAVTGRYTPALVQIDNYEGGMGNRAPWNASYADIVYETPLYKHGETRISNLFSDLIPDYVGPVRSARVNHVWIREEWDAAFIFWGGQQYTKTNIYDQFKSLGVNQKGLLFDGTTGAKAWNKYMDHTEVMARPHNAYAMLASLMTQVYPQDFSAPNHAFRFTDTLPADGDEASTIYVKWGDRTYHSIIEYDEEENLYYRYVSVDDVATEDELYDEIYPVLKRGTGIPHGNPVTFSNVIVQFMDCEYPTTDGPLPTVTGTGNAEFFMGGRHIPGVWNRETLQDRTAFYDMNGDEIELQRGHTLIIMMDYQTQNRSISYE